MFIVPNLANNLNQPFNSFMNDMYTLLSLLYQYIYIIIICTYIYYINIDVVCPVSLNKGVKVQHDNMKVVIQL